MSAETKNKKIRIIVTIIFILITIFVNDLSWAKDDFYLFSYKGEYIQLSLEKNKVIKKGNLWKEEVYRAYKGFIDHKHNRMYLKSDYAIFILDAQKLTVLKKIEFPSSPQDFIGLTISPDGNKFAISIFNDKDDEEYAQIYDAKTFNVIKDIKCGFYFNEKSYFLNENVFVCIEEKDAADIIVTNLEKNIILDKIPIKSISKDFKTSEKIFAVDSYKGSILFRTTSLVDLKDKTKGRKVDNVFIYDLLKKTKSSKTFVNIDGDYKIIPNTRKMIVFEKEDISKQPGVSEMVPTGKLHIYDLEENKKLSTVTVPKAGRMAGFSENGKQAYYVTSDDLIVIDTEKGSIIKSVRYLDDKEIKKEYPYYYVAVH